MMHATNDDYFDDEPVLIHGIQIAAHAARLGTTVAVEKAHFADIFSRSARHLATNVSPTTTLHNGTIKAHITDTHNAMDRHDDIRNNSFCNDSFLPQDADTKPRRRRKTAKYYDIQRLPTDEEARASSLVIAALNAIALPSRIVQTLWLARKADVDILCVQEAAVHRMGTKSIVAAALVGYKTYFGTTDTSDRIQLVTFARVQIAAVCPPNGEPHNSWRAQRLSVYRGKDAARLLLVNLYAHANNRDARDQLIEHTVTGAHLLGGGSPC